MKNLVTRTISGIIYVALIVLAVIWAKDYPLLFIALFGVFVLIGIYELSKLTSSIETRSPLLTTIDMMGGLGCFVAFFVMHSSNEPWAFWLLPLLIYFVARCVMQLFTPRVDAIKSLERSFLCMTYVAFPLSLLNSIVAVTHPHMLLALFIMIWVNDTGAFLVGCSIGKHRLFERISPKKSWEGFFGGMLFCVGFGLLCHFVFNNFFPAIGLWQWIVLAVIVSIAATLGDLVESLIKRTAGVKDSGNIIPGHGGLLDRIDSLLLVAPVALAYFLILSYI